MDNETPESTVAVPSSHTAPRTVTPPSPTPFVVQLPEGMRNGAAGAITIRTDPLDTRNPEHLICGAKIANSEKDGGEARFCQNVPGTGTDHFGTGKCKFHGGSSTGRPIIHGRRSKRLRTNVMEEIERVKSSPDLLRLDTEIAVMKVQLRRQLEIAAEQEVAWQEWLDTCEANGIDPVDADMPIGSLGPDTLVDVELIKTLSATIKTAYEMQFSKRFSVPLKDVAMLILQMGNGFNEVVASLPISDDVKSQARLAFGKRMNELRISGPLSGKMDPQLAAAGESRGESMVIDA